MKKFILFLQCLLLLVALPSWILAQDNSNYISRLDSLVQAKYDEGKFNGSILVKRGDEIIYKKAMGWANFEAKETLKLTTPTRLASVTKSLTAVCVLKLVEEGKINLDEDINTYIPEIQKTGITIHHLLSHTSGIAFINHPRHYKKITKITLSEGVKRTSNEHVLKYFEREQPVSEFRPGEEWAYRNVGFSILASLIERVSEISYGDYLKQNIFDPLGMENSYLFIPAIYQNNDSLPRAISYKFNKKIASSLGPYWYDSEGKLRISDAIYGDKNVYSTVEDMEKFNTAFLNGNIISSKYVNLALTPVELNSGEINKDKFGYGFQIKEKENENTIFMHTGGMIYYGAMNMMVDKKYQIILLINALGAYYELVNGCYDILENKPLKPPKRSRKDKRKAKIFNEQYRIDY